MKKGKLKYISFNLLWSLPTLSFSFTILGIMNLNLWHCFIISFAIYFKEVIQGCENDYLENEIENLKKSKI